MADTKIIITVFTEELDDTKLLERFRIDYSQGAELRELLGMLEMAKDTILNEKRHVDNNNSFN